MPQDLTGAAAQAIQAAEVSLARQNSAAAQVDLQVISAILNAHTVRADGADDLMRLQADVESAVATRTDLDTPAGARSFQHYLLSRLREIRAVVENAGLDATSKAALSAALASLYASATPGAADAAVPGAVWPVTDTPPMEAPPMEALPAQALPAQAPPVDLGLGGSSVAGMPDAGSAALPPAAATPPMAAFPPLTSWGAAPTSGGGPPTLSPFPDVRPRNDRHTEDMPARHRRPDDGTAEQAADQNPHPDVSVNPEPPGGDAAASPEVASVIAAAVAGTPIPEAFAQQGISIPPPGAPVAAPLDPARVIAGDVGVFTDRHALALGQGKALLDNRIQLITEITDLGFLGWVHPVPDRPRAGAPVAETPIP